MAIFAFLRSLLESMMQCYVCEHSASAHGSSGVAGLQDESIETPTWPGLHDADQASEESTQQHPRGNGRGRTFEKTGQRSNLGNWHDVMLTGAGARVAR